MIQRREFLGVRFDCVGMDEALAFVGSASAATRMRYVVTPNVDHLVRLHYAGDPEVRAAYDEADLCLCDSRVIRGLAWIEGIRLKTVPGSDLVEALIPAHMNGVRRVTLVGGGDDDAARLAKMLPAVAIAHHQPPMGMLHKPEAMQAAVQFVIDTPAELVLLAVGSPQQEIIAHRVALSGRGTGVALCIGAGIDFVTGTKQRAPRVLRLIGLEWLFRLLMEPRRLWRRYLINSPRIFLIMARWRRTDPPLAR